MPATTIKISRLVSVVAVVCSIVAILACGGEPQEVDPTDPDPDRDGYNQRTVLKDGTVIFEKDEDNCRCIKNNQSDRWGPQPAECKDCGEVFAGDECDNCKDLFDGRFRCHIVRKNETLSSIAEDITDTRREKNPEATELTWETLFLVNRSFLIRTSTEACENCYKGEAYWCNDKISPSGIRTMKPANTIEYGWTILIPLGNETEEPHEAEKKKELENTLKVLPPPVIIVLDSTGSMRDDRLVVFELWRSVVKKSGKAYNGTIYFSGRDLTFMKPGGDIEDYPTTGARENTWAALQHAVGEGAGSIVLISDERGDDWPTGGKSWSIGVPIGAHCLPSNNPCTQTFPKLVQSNPGSKYLYWDRRREP